MPKFVAIGYGDQTGYNRTDSAVRAAAHARDDQLRSEDAVIGIAGPPVRVSNPDDAGVRTEDGAYMTSALPVAGFSIIEAATLAEAIEKVSGTPCSVAHGVVEVWPLQQA